MPAWVRGQQLTRAPLFSTKVTTTGGHKGHLSPQLAPSEVLFCQVTMTTMMATES